MSVWLAAILGPAVVLALLVLANRVLSFWGSPSATEQATEALRRRARQIARRAKKQRTKHAGDALRKLRSDVEDANEELAEFDRPGDITREFDRLMAGEGSGPTIDESSGNGNSEA